MRTTPMFRVLSASWLALSAAVPSHAKSATPIGMEEILFGDIPIVYIASGKKETVTDAPAHVHVVTGEEMRKRGYRSLMDLIPDLPSSTVIPMAGDPFGYPRPPEGGSNHRGVQGGLKIMVNGMETDARHGSGTIWAENFPIEGVDRVEFILGPYASLYGRNTYSGVLNVVLKTGEQVDGGSVHALYGNSTEYNTVNQYQGTMLLGKKWGGTDVYLSVFRNFSRNGLDMAKDYPGIYGRGVRENGTFRGLPVTFSPTVSRSFIMPWDNQDAFVSIKHDIGLSFDGQYNQEGDPYVVPRYNPNNYVASRNSSKATRSMNGRLRYAHDWDRLGVETSVAGQRWHRKYKILEVNGRVRWFYKRTESQRGNATARLKITEGNEALLSVSREFVREYDPGAVSDTNAGRSGWPALNFSEDDRYTNVSIQDEARLFDGFKVVAGTMWEESNRNAGVFVPRLSVMWDVNPDATLKVLYGEGYNTQSRDSISNQNNIMAADPDDITPARIRSIDMQWIQKVGAKAKASAAAFYTRQFDLMDRITDPTLPAPFTSQYRKINGLRETYGGELELEASLGEKTRGFLFYSYVDGWSTAIAGQTVEKQYGALFAPRHAVKAGLHRLLWDDKLNLYVHNILYGKSAQWQGVGLGKSWNGSYNVTDLHLMTTDAFNKRWSLSLGVDNVFNKEGFIARPLSKTTGGVAPDFFMIDSPIRKRFYTVQLSCKI